MKVRKDVMEIESKYTTKIIIKIKPHYLKILTNTKRYTFTGNKEKWDTPQITRLGKKWNVYRGIHIIKRNTNKCKYQMKWTLFKKM